VDRRKPVVVRLDPSVYGDLGDLAKQVGVNRTALMQAAAELWVKRWKRAGSLEEFSARYQITDGDATHWDNWVARAREIDCERRSRGHRERRAVLVRLNPEALQFARQIAHLLGQRMLTAFLQSTLEYWMAYWEESGVEPCLNWPSDDGVPDWFPLWRRWCRLARLSAEDRPENLQSAMFRLDAEVAVAFERMVQGAGLTITAMAEGLIRVWMEGWAAAGTAPTLVWPDDSPPAWWDDWTYSMERAQEIAATRRGMSTG
jgi:hypothetical protein